MNNPLPCTAKVSIQMCQQKQTDGVTVVVKNTAEDFEAAKASHKCKNRLETKYFNTISVCVAPNGVQRRVFAPKGVCYVNQLFYYRPNDKSTISKAVVAYAYEVWDEVEAQCTIRERFVTR